MPIPCRTAPLRFLALLFLALGAQHAFADAGTSPAVGERIVALINARDADGLAAMINSEALAQRSVAGVELKADARAAFIRGLVSGLPRTCDTLLKRIELNRGTAKLVKSSSDARGTLQIVRVTMADAEGEFDGADYLAFEIDRRGRIVDWTSYAVGSQLSRIVQRLLLVMLDDGNLLAKALGITRIDQDTVKLAQQIGERMKAQDYAATYRLLERMPEAYRATADWAAMRVSMASQLDEATYRASLEHAAAKHADVPAFAFMLIDHYFYQHDYSRAIASTETFERSVVEDGITHRLKCTIANEAGKTGMAEHFCKRSIALEPEEKDSWWLLVGIANATRNSKLALDTLGRYETQFDMQFDPDKLVTLEGYEWLAESSDFEPWAVSRR